MFQYLKGQWENGRAIYGKKSWRETRRVLLHFLRTIGHKKEVMEYKSFFENYMPDKHILDKQEGLYELMSRGFLFKESTMRERIDFVKNHFTALEQIFKPSTIEMLYNPESLKPEGLKQGLLLWEDKELNMTAYLNFMTGQRKEGLFTILLQLGTEGVYHANIYLGKGLKGEPALWIGTIQGYKDGLENSKYITKKMFGYRPKNFIVFLTRELAKYCNVQSIYAVSDEGFYANTHMVRGHKAKVAELNSLWKDIGGEITKDSRFFTIPLEEYRKPIEEIKSQKRSQYKKRYILLDKYKEDIKANILQYLK